MYETKKSHIEFRVAGNSPWSDTVLSLLPTACYKTPEGYAMDEFHYREEAAKLLASGDDEITKASAPKLQRFVDGTMAAAIGVYTDMVWKFEGKVLEADVRSWVLNNATADHHSNVLAHLTAIYYIDASDAHVTDSKAIYPGDVVFSDPREAVLRNYPEAVRRQMLHNHVEHPNRGDLLVFPSYLQNFSVAAPASSQLMVMANFTFKPE